MKRFLLFLRVSLAVSFPVIPKRNPPPDAVVSRWMGRRRAVSFSWDDGNDPQVTFLPTVMTKYGLSGTFYISTMFMDPVDDRPTPDQMTDKWEHARHNLMMHEIGLHSATHLNMNKEIDETVKAEFAQNRIRLENEFSLPKDYTWTLAWPFGIPKRGVDLDVLAMRTTNCAPNDWDRMPYHELHACDWDGNQQIVDDKWVIYFGHGADSCAMVDTNWEDVTLMVNESRHRNAGPAKASSVSAIRNRDTGETIECRYGWSPIVHGNVERRLSTIDNDTWVAPIGRIVRYHTAAQQATILTKWVRTDCLRIEYADPMVDEIVVEVSCSAFSSGCDVVTDAPDLWHRDNRTLYLLLYRSNPIISVNASAFAHVDRLVGSVGFVHITKTGGTSMDQMYRLIGSGVHADYVYVAQRAKHVITVFREPVERAISNIEYWKTLYLNGTFRSMSIDEIVMSDRIFDNIRGAWADGYGAASWLTGYDTPSWSLSGHSDRASMSNRMDRARRGAHDMIEQIVRESQSAVLGLSWIGIFERFPECIRLLNYLLGLPTSKDVVPVANSNSGKSRASAAVRGRIRQQIPIDLKIYAFAKKAAEQRLRTFQALAPLGAPV